MKKKYPSLAAGSGANPFKLVILIGSVVILGAFFYGSKQMFDELRAISEGQQQLILKLTSNQIHNEVFEEVDEAKASGEYISKVEFVKFKNETRKTIRDLAKDLRRVQAKLRMKQTILDKY